MEKVSKVFGKYGIFFIVPGIVLVYSILLKLAAGPYWLAPNFDPTYQYLVNGVRMVKGLVPNHIDHPGTPLQMLCCVVCWLFNLGRSVTDVATHVFSAPEFYLSIVFVTLSFFSFITSIGLAVYVFRKTDDRLAALLTQLPAISLLVMEAAVTPVSPEPLLISVVNLFNICLFKRFFAKTSKGEYAATIFWGFVCGLGVAVKLTFIPLLLIPLIILSWKNKILFAGVFIASFVLWTLPILSLYPVLWGWVARILTHTGQYGTGGSGVIEIHSYVLSWMTIIVDQWVFVSILFAALVLCFWNLSRKRLDGGGYFLLVTILGVLFQFAVVAKHPGIHYLLPGVGLFSALLVLFYLQGLSRHVLGQRIVLVFILVFILAGVWQANKYRSKLVNQTKDILTFHKYVHEKYKDFLFIGYYRSSGQEEALSFGDEYSGSWNELFRLYPNSFIFNRFSNRIINFKERVFSDDLLSQYRGVIFEGDGSFDFSPTPYSVHLLEKGRFESIYLLTGTTEKQALMSHLAAVHFFQSGDYEKAIAYEEQATALHYLP